ncbi:hypothetical protein FHEFKHOI_01772 [Candidatus Methanoperedenaceae archaeon GB50]|nr:MAG: hypothetical protein KBONHNOK_00127 [Candidatus Methanoperedenaceae archaeon GB50]CAD7775429.1 hypothetical protein FHEFKHOI_01772 [Candidatus Methanoperedenaceae archaeon GB50]
MIVSASLYLLAWLSLVLLLGIAAYPLTRRSLSGLVDSYGLSKICGVVLFTYLAWLSSFIGIGVLPIFVVLITGGAILSLYKRLDFSLFGFYEFLFALSFLSFALVRSFYPEIYGAEKFMDFAILNTLFRAESFPPFDPWLSGKYLDFYYYFGHLMVATIGKLTGTPPEVAYNLGLSLFFALSITTAVSLGYNLTGRKSYGLLAAFLVVLSGNLRSVVLALETAYHGFMPSISYYWSSSRVIPNTVNEFPSFTFLHGDLHAHLAAIPLQLLFLLLLLNLYRSLQRGRFGIGTGILTGFVLGFLFPVNSWDYPTYLFITVMITVYLLGRGGQILKVLFIIIGSSLIFFIPFHASFHPSGVSGVGLVGVHTRVIDYILVFGLMLLPLTLFVAHQHHIQPLGQMGRGKLLSGALSLTTLLALLTLSYLRGVELPFLLIVMLAICIRYLYRAREGEPSGDTPFVMILIISGLLVSIFCELFYVRDSFAHPLERFNTVFKLYLQVWILFAVSASFALSQISGRLEGSVRSLYVLMITFLLISGIIFPATTAIVLTNGFSGGFSGEPSLDGMRYLKEWHPGDYHAIRWMRANLRENDIVLERWGESYTLTGRVSANTGIPTPLGWAGHEIIWRSNQTLVNQRLRDVDTIYTTENTTRIRELLRKYRITHIYVGKLERERYGDLALKLDETLDLVYEDRRNSTAIYQVNDGNG